MPSSPKPAAVGAQPSWDEITERLGVRDATDSYGLDAHAPDARMVATLRNVTGLLLGNGPQLFVTNGFLCDWSRLFARALRRLGTPTARRLAALHLELVDVANRAAVLDRRGRESADAERELDRLGHRVWRMGQRVARLEPALLRDVARYVDGHRAGPSTKPWPRAPRLSAALRERWP